MAPRDYSRGHAAKCSWRYHQAAKQAQHTASRAPWSAAATAAGRTVSAERRCQRKRAEDGRGCTGMAGDAQMHSSHAAHFPSWTI